MDKETLEKRNADIKEGTVGLEKRANELQGQIGQLQNELQGVVNQLATNRAAYNENQYWINQLSAPVGPVLVTEE